MSPPDPKPREQDEAEDEAALDAASDLASLKASADIVGLLALAKAYRSGAAPGGRDMKKCLETYEAAAELGSAEAEYAVALFHLSGGVVAQDLKLGATRLRSAAEKGSVPARVYLGNLYEQGIHYKADPEKADVWYRNAARVAKVEAEPGTEEHTRALAELGCVRYVLALVETGAVPDEEKTRLLARAKAHGYGLRVRDDKTDGERVTFTDALASAEDAAPAPQAAAAAPVPERQRANTLPASKAAREKKEAEARERAEDTGKHKKVAPATKGGGPSARVREALGAFGYALLFVLAGLGAAYAATLGARELVAHGHALPLLEKKTHLVFPILLAAIGVLPAWLVYKLGTVLKAVALGGVAGAIGWVAWGTGTGMLHPLRETQVIAFALAGFLSALLVLGFFGGTKAKRTNLPRR
jgi:hypothetical protein